MRGEKKGQLTPAREILKTVLEEIERKYKLRKELRVISSEEPTTTRTEEEQ